MAFDLQKIIQGMGPFAMAIALALLAMAVVSLAVCLERMWVYFRAARSTQKFARQSMVYFTSNDLARIVQFAQERQTSFVAQVVGHGAAFYLQACRRGRGQLSPVELTRREMVRTHEDVVAQVRRGLSVIATIGSIAPFVGLLGTVVGIITAFEGIAREGSGGLGAVSGGIAEALVVTALGLVVAIPAVMMFNYLTSRTETLIANIEKARGELLDHIEYFHTDVPTLRKSEVKIGIA